MVGASNSEELDKRKFAGELLAHSRRNYFVSSAVENGDPRPWISLAHLSQICAVIVTLD